MRHRVLYVFGIIFTLLSLTSCSTQSTALSYDDHLSYDDTRKLIVHDLYDQYDITGLDIPKVQQEADKLPPVPYPWMKKKLNSTKESWLDSFYNKNLDPAKIRVRTSDYINHTYEVTLEDGTAKLYPLEKSPDTSPDPKELLKD